MLFPSYFCSNEIPTRCQVTLIMKLCQLANWQHYVSNLMCCFSCCTVCVCLNWGWRDGAMWCYCFTKCAVSVAVPSVFVCTEDEQMEQSDSTASPNVLVQFFYRLCLFGLRMNRCSNVLLLLHQMCCFSCCTVCVCLYWGWTDGEMWCYCFNKCAVSVAVPSVFVCTEDEQMEKW
jgi:hypothetical protein